MNKFRRSLLSILTGGVKYTVVNCVVGTNLTAIDLEYTPTNNTIVEIDMLVPRSGYPCDIAGCIDTNRFYTFQNNSAELYYYTGVEGWPFNKYTDSLFGARKLWKLQKGGLYIDNTLFISSDNNIDGNVSFYVLNANFNGQLGTTDLRKSNMKVYGVKIYEGNRQTANIVPCLTENGEVKMYDTIRKRFIETVQGTLSYEA